MVKSPKNPSICNTKKVTCSHRCANYKHINVFIDREYIEPNFWVEFFSRATRKRTTEAQKQTKQRASAHAQPKYPHVRAIRDDSSHDGGAYRPESEREDPISPHTRHPPSAWLPAQPPRRRAAL